MIPHFTEGKYSGSVVVKGKEIAKTPVYEISEDVGSVFQNPKTQFFNLDSDSELVFGMENLGIEPNKINARVQEVVHDLMIENLLGRSVFGLSGWIFLCGSTAVPEERIPPIQRQETAVPEQRYRT